MAFIITTCRPLAMYRKIKFLHPMGTDGPFPFQRNSKKVETDSKEKIIRLSMVSERISEKIEQETEEHSAYYETLLYYPNKKTFNVCSTPLNIAERLKGNLLKCFKS